jgi:hypothetical protein
MNEPLKFWVPAEAGEFEVDDLVEARGERWRITKAEGEQYEAERMPEDRFRHACFGARQ